ncbi:acyl-CoA dehydrogenase family protein [Mycobacterium sp. 1274761.0]|uniref:acyl-CoA dehydrogenase family protein n=1 Tax=Mycobacterium sp. 1274761.0 TaxID=1834077 RepID=UPI0008014C5D|nr:acyl-CoA dehydrogenase family protein [Mycobacterium sp. 1274761.0]OBK72512.1 acyl-CoA dehydrogenase [Mycobacterium sp. 1274761.0]
MNLELTDEQIALRETVRKLLAEKACVATYVRPLLDDPTGITDDVWRSLASLGATGVLVPQEHGGLGMTMVEAGVVAEQLGAALHPGPWLSSAVGSVRALLRLGAGDDLLTGIARGTTIATVGIGGTRPVVDGGALRGELTAVPDVAAAAVLLVLADDGGDTALYAVDPAAAGVTVTPRRHVDPTHKAFDVLLEGVTAPRLADAPAEAVSALVDDMTIIRAADALGAAAAVMNLAVDYAKTRRQFGHPVGSFQAVQHLCVDMFEAVELARSGVIHALWAADAAEAAERHLAAVRAKAFAGRLTSVGDTAIQVFGGIGFTWEHDAHLYLKRLLGWSAYLGAPERYLEELGTHLVSDNDRKVLQ